MRMTRKEGDRTKDVNTSRGVVSDWQSRGSDGKHIYTTKPQKRKDLVAPGKIEMRGSML